MLKIYLGEMEAQCGSSYCGCAITITCVIYSSSDWITKSFIPFS